MILNATLIATGPKTKLYMIVASAKKMCINQSYLHGCNFKLIVLYEHDQARGRLNYSNA